MSLILKESPIGVTQTCPLFRLANLNGYRHITEIIQDSVKIIFYNVVI